MKMRRIARGVGALVAVLAAFSLGSSQTGASTGVGAWQARVVVRGHFSDLVTNAGDLYGVEDLWHDGIQYMRVVRLDTSTGGVVARSTEFSALGSPVFAGGHVWVSGFAPSNTNGFAAPVLVRLDPSTLVRQHEVRLRGTATSNLMASSGLLVSTTLTAAGCSVAELNPASGLPLSGAIHLELTQTCVGAALSNSGTSLFLVLGDATSSSWGIEQYDVATGTRVNGTSIPALGRYAEIAVDAQYVWIVSGSPGANGGAVLLNGRTTKVLAESGTWSGTSVSGAATRRVSLPTFSQWPRVDVSGGAVWIASDGVVACFAPGGTRALSYHVQSSRPMVSNSVVILGSSAWAVSDDPTGSSGVVRFNPPSACFASTK